MVAEVDPQLRLLCPDVRQQMLRHRLIESVIISVTGGLLGILVGCGASEFIVPLFNMPSSVPAWSIYVSFLVCVCIGVLFGYIPAQKAANMDPIEAIRHE